MHSAFHFNSNPILCLGTTTGTKPPLRIVEKNVRSGAQRLLSLNGGESKDILTPSLQQQYSTDAVAAVRSFFLPQGWPTSVTSDYYKYQLWTFPSHVTGWMSHSLASSSMLKALGVGGGPAGAVGFSAAIRWVTKDGVGAIGRLFVGGRLSAVFDEDPRRWRMIAEAVTTLGLALEIATQVSPANFVTLAGLGSLAKATGKGMGRPCFRVVQTHFALTNNVGDVSAKEEVWEVAAQMAGLAASVALLTAVEASGMPEAVVPLWAGIHATHVALRYHALTVLRFPYPNFKRGAALVKRHVSDGTVLSIEDANAQEPVLQGPETGGGLNCTFGCTVDEALGVSALQLPGGEATDRLKEFEELMEVYQGEGFVLTWREGSARVVLWEGAGAEAMLRALWQAAWLQVHCGGVAAAGVGDLRAGVSAMRQKFPTLQEAAAAAGWELHRGVFPCGPHRLSMAHFDAA